MGGVMRKSLSSSSLLLILFSSICFTFSISADEPECIYGIYVQTGSIRQAGTHSVISLSLSDATGARVEVPNLEDWGLMGPGYNYFETGFLDLFGGRGPCLNGPVCGLNLTSDGSGPYHAWYCDFVEVSSFGAGKQCARERFEVDQWLGTDREPYELTAVRSSCLSSRGYGGAHTGSSRF